MKVEFFHDVICSFCFPMSDRMREMADKYSSLEIQHKSFALGWDAEDFIRSFGSREAVKPEVLNHWVHANENDEKHRFNIEGMKQTDFVFPLSKPGLMAAKAAGIVGGEDLYWAVFDKIQQKLFMENKNVEDITVLEEAVKETEVPFDLWKAQFENQETEEAVLADLKLARAYGVHSAPTLIIEGKYAVSGAVPKEELERIFEQIAEKEGLSLHTLKLITAAGAAGACHLDGDQWVCD
jgi:predicted DsbA family dithiol-disulfide isomerase